jgi:serine/threonine-protein kinase
MAEVYRAQVLSGPRTGSFVALKRLAPSLSANPADVERFTSEAHLSQRLDHPHIIKVFETGAIESTYFIAMEFVDGTDLARLLRRCRASSIQLPVDFAVYLAKVLLDALAYAHTGLKIIHCDVSPSNLFISRTGEIKLGDFGLAQLRSGRREDGEVRGKAPYLSPEAIEGKVTPAADLWASNVTLYELLTLERPFAAESEAAVLDAIRQGRYRALRELRPEVPVALADVVDRGFSAKASARFQTAEEFAQALALHFDERVGNPLAIAAVVRGLFGADRLTPL